MHKHCIVVYLLCSVKNENKFKFMKTSILKEFGLENFRVFKDKTSFELAPITLLTGANSSGKSSVIKAMKLMQNFHKINCYEKDYKNPVLDFREDDSHAYHHQLGDFEFVINDENIGKKEFSVSFKIPLNIGEHFENSFLLKGKKKTLVDTIKLFDGFSGALCVENTFLNAENSDKKNGELIRSSIYAEYGDKRIKLIEWHKETWPSSGFDIDLNKNIDFEDSKWDYYANYVAIVKFILMSNPNMEELLRKFNMSKDYKLINQIPQSLRDLIDNYSGANLITDTFASSILLLTDDKLIDFEREVWKVLVKMHPKKLKQLTYEDFAKKTRELQNDVVKFDTNWLNNSFLLPAELVLFFGKKETALLTIKDYIQNPFKPITDFNEQHGIFVDNESFDQWVSVLNYLELLEYYIISSGENRVSDFYKKNKSKYENYYLSYHFKNVKQEEFFFIFCEKINLFLDSALQLYFADCEFVEATKANTQRLYTFISQGTSFNKYLADYIERSHTEEIETFFNKWLTEFEIGDKLDLETGLVRGVGVQLNIIKGNKSRNIVEFGYGITQMIALILRIVSAVEENKTTIIIEEPESNLHPKLQSKLADLFIDANNTFGLNFIIETHSEYLIRRTQVITAEQNYIDQEDVDKNNIFKVYYFPTKGIPYNMGYTLNGRFIQKFGEGFFDEAGKWHLEIIKKERGL